MLSILLLVLINNGHADQSPKPYVILISFDGFRWDYPQRGLPPHLKFIEENGVTALSLMPVFPSKTFPNHTSIITGMYPENHGIIHNEFYDLFSGEKYKVGDEKSIRNAKWYLGEAFWETAERQGIITASYFWPGSEVTLDYRRPTYFERYDQKRSYEKRIDGALDWLQLPEEKRPHFITLYFEATDSEGHRHGPDSPQTNLAIQKLDSTLGLLFSKLKMINFLDQVNIIVVSDHGMTSVDNQRMINIEKILGDLEYRLQGYGPVMMVDCEENLKDKVFTKLLEDKEHYEVYLKENIPDFYHFKNHSFISPIILVADMGWTLVDTRRKLRLALHSSGGNHGYDNHHLDMHGIFYALGPAFKKEYRTGTLLNIDIYPLLCEIFDIMPRQNIDGKLERIGFILK